MAKVVLTGGGTAGHIMPNLALLSELRKYFDTIFYIGGDGMEKELVNAENIPFHRVSCIKFDRSDLIKNVKIPFTLARGISEAKTIMSILKPDVVFSKGGYVALPACYAAKSLKIPLVVHESDFTMGLANKITAKFAKKVLTSFEETEGGECVGNPIRTEILHGDKKNIVLSLDLDIAKKTVLIMGGSIGAESINEVVYQGIKEFAKRYNIVHISGKSGKFDIKHKYYNQLRFTDRIADYFDLADCIVSRAGANTLCEVASLGKHSISIPLPKGNSRGDQLDNALSFEKRGMTEILLQEDLYVESLIAKIEAIWNKKQPILNIENINKNVVKSIVDAMK
ncbi:MAG TPA: UDP-N-acetylglucosamine--N-acetylmuramyl-(pentapeptide) pyrophosphoryl-undecaprenol N-acetylglucosamine transferase [Clostridia bacterium]|nr:UDP-N-acetylglucosamine--N-acetylmuramyl-(pentapeptide) pyrophosphoryl-undecaprenol N-acetylglucosamine transferase [Clostridia bacterium]